MLTKNEKRNSRPPDIRLAKAFNFTSEDLAANRLGFITSAQETNTVVWQRDLFSRLGTIFKPLSNKQRAEVGKRCGRVEINHEVRPWSDSISRSITHMIDDYSLSIKDKRFILNQARYQAITNKVFYTVYYDVSNYRIVAIERVPYDC